MSSSLPDPLAWLARSGAQGDVLSGLARFKGDWPALYRDCPRGDWLLGIVTRLGVPHTMLVAAAVACARVALPLAEGDAAVAEPLARLIDATEGWLTHRASKDDVKAATAALDASSNHASSPASEAAARAGLALGLGVEDREVLPTAAAAAAEAHMIASIDCGLELAMRWAHDACASAVRRAVPWGEVERCVRALP